MLQALQYRFQNQCHGGRHHQIHPQGWNLIVRASCPMETNSSTKCQRPKKH